MILSRAVQTLSRTATLVLAFSTLAPAQSMPHFEKKGDRYAFIVDGKPFLVLAGQINNSSSWASELPLVWSTVADLHMNTVEAPVYWEQIEAKQGTFDFANVDLLVNQAREHNVHLVLLWFGTWKNGQNHYVPEWIKTDPTRYPREITASGKLLDVMSPHGSNTLEADKHAFAALMHHLKETDSDRHTVVMIQVENESGSVGSVRDFSPAAEKLFAQTVPAKLSSGLNLPKAGTWKETFGAEADESFAAYATASYINEVARAGKQEYPLPMYCNVWVTYPVHALENRDRASAGQEYPSGGPQQQNIAIWKTAAPAIDMLSPDYYSDDVPFYRSIIAAYNRPDNPLYVPETGISRNFGRYLYYALGQGAIGFSPFGIDRGQWEHPSPDREAPPSPAKDYAMLGSLGPELAQLNFDGKLQTAIEEPGMARKTIAFADVDAITSFGFPQRDGEVPPGTTDSHGRALVAQIGPLEFLVTGVDASVSFRFSKHFEDAHNLQLEILTAEEGTYVNGVWTRTRILNGDETDRGLNFHSANAEAVLIHFHALPLLNRDLIKK